MRRRRKLDLRIEIGKWRNVGLVGFLMMNFRNL